MNPSQRLSDWIAQDLATRLASSAPLPFRLNSLELARHYGSSRTPVNQALETLIGRGLLEKRPNGRLARTQPPPPNDLATHHATSGQEASRQSIRDQMVQEVVRLSLQGQANFLRENVWSERLGVGRGGLRLLFSELAGQGLVVHVPRRGWQVRPFDASDMLQYLEIREVLELAALDLAQGRLDSTRLHEMLEGNPTTELPSPTPTAPAPLNNEIHGYLVQQAGNRYIADFFHRHSNYYSQLFQMAAVETGWRDAMAQQHRQILTALLDQDWHSARIALADHIRAQRPVVQALLRQVRSPEGPFSIQ